MKIVNYDKNYFLDDNDNVYMNFARTHEFRFDTVGWSAGRASGL